MALTGVVGQCIVAGLLSGRYRLERGFRINGQIAWMLIGAAIFIGAILGFSWLEGITLAQLQLGCLLAKKPTAIRTIFYEHRSQQVLPRRQDG